MNSRTFFVLQAAIAVIYAVGFLIIPRTLSGIYGVMSGPGAVLAFRFFGVALLGLGLIMWFVRDVQDQTVRSAVLTGAGIANLVGVLVSLWGTTSGIMNGLGWMVVALYAALTAGCLYFRTPDRILTLDTFQIGAMRRKS